MYKLTSGNTVIDTTYRDGKSRFVPVDSEEYVQWLADGNIPEPEFTQAELDAVALQSFIQSVQSAIDDTDRTMIRISQGVALGTCAFNNTDVVSFVEYIHALRALLSSTKVGTLPTKPPYPAGS